MYSRLRLSSFLLLLTTFRPGTAQTDPSPIALIRNTLNLYADLISFDNYANLSAVFTPDASFNSATTLTTKTPFSIFGLPAIQTFIASQLANFTSRHYDADQVVAVGPLNDTADAFSQEQSVYFGQEGGQLGNGRLTGKICTAYSEFQDKLVLQQDGKWLISNRTVLSSEILTCAPMR
ncbi:MAG: hypothetical protein Q9187_002455 [Circinaria calcarea]